MGSTELLKSIYIHIPFCTTKCNYCNFISFPRKQAFIESYFVALEKEISFNLKERNPSFNTVYIGGGTPSITDGFYYEKLLCLINLFADAEITIEVNPGTASLQYLEKLREIGFNRLSIGVQSFNNGLLSCLNRQHSAEDAVNTVKQAREAGFANIGIDLMYGLPGQGLPDWEKTLHKAISLDLEHISAYGLKIEAGTKFGETLPQNLPDEDETVRMYLKTIEILENNGFIHYEISNFCKPGHESKHNLAYWNNREYFGFGLGAHGYVDGVRYSNSEVLEDYIARPTRRARQKRLSKAEIEEEGIFLGLRLRNGLDISGFKGKYSDIIDKYTLLGLVCLKNNRLALTPEGILLSNNILAEFIKG